jgi:hypothetical protein
MADVIEDPRLKLAKIESTGRRYGEKAKNEAGDV